MESKTNIMISNKDDEENETVTLSYIVKDVGSLASAEDIKAKLDEAAESFGATVHKKSVEVKN